MHFFHNNKTGKIKVENSAQTTLRLSPVIFTVRPFDLLHHKCTHCTHTTNLLLKTRPKFCPVCWSLFMGPLKPFFCQWVAAWVTVIFWNFYFEKNNKIANNSAITEATIKASTKLESLKFLKLFDICLTLFWNYSSLLNKISHRILVATKLFAKWNIPSMSVLTTTCIDA
jgi:hypothetical protein